MHLLTSICYLLPLLVISEAAKPKVPKDAILLSQVKSLTLRSNAQTSHRRVSAIPQLTCTGPGCKHYNVDVMRCTNQGSAYNTEDIEWSCTASLPEEFKLGSTEVICEGYANRDDEYVLKGSCGVEYRLLLTDKGEEKYGKPSFWSSNKNSKAEDPDSWSLTNYLFAFAFVGVLIWILYAAITAPPGPPRPARQGGGRGGWGGGGGGGGDPWDPPPPYPGKRYGYGQQEGWRPGFWSGTAAGAAAGYAAGRAGRQAPAPAPVRNTGWFGGGEPSAPRRTTSGSSSDVGSRHESTGFGSTSRR